MLTKIKRYIFLWLFKPNYDHKDTQHCLHSYIFLKLVVPESCHVAGTLSGYYKCIDCGQKFRSNLTPLEIVVSYKTTGDKT